jgi:ubiquitin carboxyl-terminal hydrolase 4/11/15
MGAQLSWSNEETLHNSIEGDGEDEAIALPDYDTTNMAGMTSVIGPSSWSFANLGSKANSEADADIASDVAQNDDSSINEDVFDDAPVGDMEHSAPVEPLSEFADFNEPPPPLDDEQDDYMSHIAAQKYVKQQVHNVPLADDLAGGDDDLASDKVAEIHLGDGDEQPAGADKPSG